MIIKSLIFLKKEPDVCFIFPFRWETQFRPSAGCLSEPECSCYNAVNIEHRSKHFPMVLVFLADLSRHLGKRSMFCLVIFLCFHGNQLSIFSAGLLISTLAHVSRSSGCSAHICFLPLTSRTTLWELEGIPLVCFRLQDVWQLLMKMLLTSSYLWAAH